MSDKNIIFYSLCDPGSIETLNLLGNNKELSKQFIKICVHDSQNPDAPNPHVRRLPPIVANNLDKLPMLFMTGMKNEKPTRFAGGVVAGIREMIERQSKSTPGGIGADGGPSGTPDGTPDDIVSSCVTIEELDKGQSAEGTSNIIVRDGKGEFGQAYSNIHEMPDMQLVQDGGSKSTVKNETTERFQQLKSSFQGGIGGNRPPPGQLPQIDPRTGRPAGEGGPVQPPAPQYNPNIGGPHMPRPPPAMGGGGNMPTMPSVPGGYGMNPRFSQSTSIGRGRQNYPTPPSYNSGSNNNIGGGGRGQTYHGHMPQNMMPRSTY